jgi:Homeodomain-like domain
MDRQTLRDSVHRYNTEGIAGLTARQSRGRPPILSELQMAELKELVVKGTDPETDEMVRWRCLERDDPSSLSRLVPTGREDDPTGGRSPVIPAKAGIHDCAARSKESRGCRPSPV